MVAFAFAFAFAFSFAFAFAFAFALAFTLAFALAFTLAFTLAARGSAARTTATAAVQMIGPGLRAGRDGTDGPQQQACDIPRLDIPLQTFIDYLGGNRSGWRYVPDIRTERNAGGAGICRQ
ncbi:MAG: hypothetical protein V3R90_07045 [Limibaculum sp.]